MKDAAIMIKEIWRGKDLYRILMNLECRKFTMRRRTLDVGSGLNQASYYRFLGREDGVEIATLDLNFKAGGRGAFINLEKDTLPYVDQSADTVLLFNVLEHIYDRTVLLPEIQRVLKDGGRAMGAVPFLVGYHPDPYDYWRYTSEALRKILEGQGFRDIEIAVLGRGPWCAAYSQVEFMLPRIVKMVTLPCVLLLDKILFILKPAINREKFSLGLFFSLSK